MTDSKKPLDRNESVCTTREAAVRLGVSLRTAQLWVDAGLLEAWKTEGGHRRISVASVDRMSKGKQAPVPESIATPVNDERLRVLVVEDDNVLLKLYRLRISGWNLPIVVSTAANGYEALVLIGREQPDLLICDLGMPGMDGFQMVQTLCKSSFREGMEIVVVTGMKTEEIADKGVLPADVHVLHKPVPFTQLKSIAESLLNRRAELG